MAELWEKLERAFKQDGKVGGNLTPLLEAEKECGLFVCDNFKRQLVLSDSFEAFFMDTLRLAEARYRKSARFQTLQWYPYLLMLELGNLRTLRAANILFMHGRAGQGYGLLRDLKDRAILLGAVANQFVTLSAISGTDSGVVKGDFLTRSIGLEKRRKKAERNAKTQMVGQESNLTCDTHKELQEWGKLFHFEVHGARITWVTEDADWLEGKELLRILPKPNIDSLALYIDCFRQICWMLLRTFPILQLEPKDFGPEWAQKWRILDESFCFMVNDRQRQGKPIASAILEFMRAKLAFDPDSTTYPSE